MAREPKALNTNHSNQARLLPMHKDQPTIAIIGLGYVGLPLAVEFGKKRNVIGFDINQVRVDQLQAGHDKP